MRYEMIKMALVLVMGMMIVGKSRAQAPGFEWVKQTMGGSSTGKDIAVDAAGNAFITGRASGVVLFDTIAGVAGQPIFLAKYDKTGKAKWVRQPSGSIFGLEERAVATDANGNCFMTGLAGGQITFGNITMDPQSSDNAFLVKYDSTGNALWAKQTRVSGGGQSFDVATDAAGNSFHLGTFRFSAVIGTTVYIGKGGTDIFLTKYSPSGNVLWARTIGGPKYELAYCVAVDAVGNSFIAGTLKDTLIIGADTLVSKGNNDVFITKYDPSGTLLWSTQVGGTGQEYAMSISTDKAGNLLMAGMFNGASVFGNASFTSIGVLNMFIAKLDTAGAVLWANHVPGAGIDEQIGIAADSIGNSYVTGTFGLPNANPPVNSAVFGTTTLTSWGSNDIFVAKYDGSGNLLWVKQAGGTGYEESCSIAIGPTGEAIITGTIGRNAGSAPGVPIQFDGFTLLSSGWYDICLAKIGTTPYVTATQNPATTSSFSLSPNPARSQVRLTNLQQPNSCTLYNLLGQPVLTQVLPVSTTEATLSLHGLAPGLYTLQVQSAGVIRSEKLVVE